MCRAGAGGLAQCLGLQLQEFLPPPPSEKTAEQEGPEESDHDMGFGLLTKPLL